MIIQGRNVNHTYRESVNMITCVGDAEDSRNGGVLVAPYPVMTVTVHPTERVLFDRQRDANPFFHFFECLWMLSGSCDGRWLDRFVKDFSSRFGDEDGIIHGAYGARWRDWSMDTDGVFDQLRTVVSLLRKNPRDRRVVISMWDPEADLAQDVGDVPCNTHMYPRIRDTKNGAVLDLTICCRSNDIIWGATGANAVHFSFVQEWMAAQIGVGVGTMYQLSNNWHAYNDTLEKVGKPGIFDPYSTGEVKPYPICSVPEEWDSDLMRFMNGPYTNTVAYVNSFFSEVAVPMWGIHDLWRNGHKEEAISLIDKIAAVDWRIAVGLWMNRRLARAGK